MKNYRLLSLSAAILVLASCGVNNNSSKSTTDSTTVLTGELSANDTLVTKMVVKDSIKVGDPVELRFTVYNTSDSSRTFCKWHTPFEPLMSKYLDIKDENGNEINYQGPMAKRMMPPPASSYTTLSPGDSVTANADLLKAYAILKPSKYTIVYNAQNMSGLVVKDSVSFVYVGE